MKTLDALARKWTGVGVLVVAALLLVFGVLGATLGWLFPKFEATALLQFPETRKLNDKKPDEQRLADLRSMDNQRSLDNQRSQDIKMNVIELPAYKRVAASYDSVEQLSAYFAAVGASNQNAALRLVKRAQGPGFWDRVAVPILPFSRRDQKEFGDIKDASATTMLGLALSADAREAVVAQEMVGLLADYYINAVVREQVRTWALAGKVDAQSQEKGVQADVLRAELDIELYRRRAEDMKAILARYPDAVRMDSRQVLSVNPADGGERYLSPLAQLVGAESAMSQRREMIQRWQRELKQKEMLAEFFAAAEKLIDQEPAVSTLLPGLKAVATKTFTGLDSGQEWHKEAVLRVNGALDNFDVMRSQFGVRNGVRVSQLGSRDPLRLAAIGAALVLVLLAAVAFLRASFRARAAETYNDELADSEVRERSRVRT